MLDRRRPRRSGDELVHPDDEPVASDDRHGHERPDDEGEKQEHEDLPAPCRRIDRYLDRLRLWRQRCAGERRTGLSGAHDLFPNSGGTYCRPRATFFETNYSIFQWLTGWLVPPYIHFPGCRARNFYGKSNHATRRGPPTSRASSIYRYMKHPATQDCRLSRPPDPSIAVLRRTDIIQYSIACSDLTQVNTASSVLGPYDATPCRYCWPASSMR